MDSTQHTLKLIIAYDGTGFSGWQRQKKDRTIQGEIEICLKRMVNEDVRVHGAGRTDAGVHAEGMVAHFQTTGNISSENFQQSLNSMLPSAIRILEVQRVTDDFHARYSAKGKHYQYTIFNGKIQPPTKRLYSLHVGYRLNLENVRECLRYLEGTFDFSSFENSGSRDKSLVHGRGAIRSIFSASLRQPDENILVFEFFGDGFLRNMVRNITGTLLDCGRGRLSPANFKDILRAKDRRRAGPAAPAHGLSLMKVIY